MSDQKQIWKKYNYNLKFAFLKTLTIDKIQVSDHDLNWNGHTWILYTALIIMIIKQGGNEGKEHYENKSTKLL